MKDLTKVKNSNTAVSDPVGLANLTDTLEKRLTPKQCEIVKQMGYSIGVVGVSLNDACLLARLSKDELDGWIEAVPELTTYFRLKQTEYKYSLLKIINAQASENKDVKIATWLLEKHFAEDYDSSVKKEMEKMKRNGTEDVMAIAVALVRKSNSHTVPVNVEQQETAVAEVIKYRDVEEILQ